MVALQGSGTLSFDLDVLPERLGFMLHAIIWISVVPQHLTLVAEQIVRQTRSRRSPRSVAPPT